MDERGRRDSERVLLEYWPSGVRVPETDCRLGGLLDEEGAGGGAP